MNTNSHYKNFAGNSRINTNDPQSVIQMNSSQADILPTKSTEVHHELKTHFSKRISKIKYESTNAPR